MDAEIKGRCEQQFKILQDLRRTMSIDNNSYYKCLVCLSFEYINGDDINYGLFLLNQCPPVYFKEVQFRQMKEDAMYSDTVVRLAALVQRRGLVEYISDSLTPTQQPGLA